MNLTKMLEQQRVLDAQVVATRGLEGKDLFPSKILALQEALGRLAGVWRGHHYWSDKPVAIGHEVECEHCQGRGFWFDGPRVQCKTCNSTGKVTSPLLLEYVDCLIHLLSIGEEMGFTHRGQSAECKYIEDVTELFAKVFVTLVDVRDDITWLRCFGYFDQLSKRLGFTDEQVEAAFDERMKERQAEYGCSPTSA